MKKASGRKTPSLRLRPNRPRSLWNLQFTALPTNSSCVVVSLDRKCLGGENVGDERKIPGRGTFDKGDLKEAAGGADDYGATSWVWYGRVCPTVRGGRSGGCSGTADGRRRWPARDGEREKQRWFQVGRHT